MQLAVLTAALFHDISRVDDSRDTTHGKRGSMLFLEYIHKRYDFKKPSYLSKAEGDLGSGGTFPSYLSLRFDSKIISEIEFACIYHCKAVDKKMHPSGRFHRDFAHVPPIFAILACADRLDRVRCGECPSTKYLYLLDGPLRSRSSVDDCSSPTSKEELKDEEELDEKKFCYYILDKNGEKVRVERERKYGLLPGDIQDKVDDVSFATDVAKLGFYPKDADKSGSLDDTVIHLEDKAGSGHETADGVPPSTKEFSFITPSSESTRAIELLKSSIDPMRIRGKIEMDFGVYRSEHSASSGPFSRGHPHVSQIDPLNIHGDCFYGLNQLLLQNFLEDKANLSFFPTLHLPFVTPQVLSRFWLCLHSKPEGIKEFNIEFCTEHGLKILRKYENGSRQTDHYYWQSFPIDIEVAKIVSCDFHVVSSFDGLQENPNLWGIRFLTPGAGDPHVTEDEVRDCFVFESVLTGQRADDERIVGEIMADYGSNKPDFREGPPSTACHDVVMIDLANMKNDSKTIKNAKNFISGKTNLRVSLSTYLHIPFIFSRYISEFYICDDTSRLGIRHFDILFTTYDGHQTLKKYQMQTFKTDTKHYFWQKFPVGIENIISCDMSILSCNGKTLGFLWLFAAPKFFSGPKKKKHIFSAHKLLKMEEEDDNDGEKEDKECEEEKDTRINSVIMLENAEFDHTRVFKGPCPIQDPCVCEIDTKTATGILKSEYNHNHLVTFLKGGGSISFFPVLHLPLVRSHYLKALYLSFFCDFESIDDFFITFTKNDGSKCVKKYHINDESFIRKYTWQLFPIDLDDVISCDIHVEARVDGKQENVKVYAIRFIIDLEKEKKKEIDLQKEKKLIIEREQKRKEIFDLLGDFVPNLENRISNLQTELDSTKRSMVEQKDRLDATQSCLLQEKQYRKELESSHRVEIDSLLSKISQLKQASESEQLKHKREMTSLKREMMNLTARCNGETPQVYSKTQNCYRNILSCRNTVLSVIKEFVELSSDESIVNAKLLTSSAEFSKEFDVNLNILRLGGIMKKCLQGSGRLCSIDCPPDNIHTLIQLIFPSQLEDGSCDLLADSEHGISPHSVISECISSVPCIPSVSSIMNRIHKLESLGTLVSKKVATDLVQKVIEFGDGCIQAIVPCLSTLLTGDPLSCPTPSALLMKEIKISPELMQSIQQFVSSSSKFHSSSVGFNRISSSNGLDFRRFEMEGWSSDISSFCDSVTDLLDSFGCSSIDIKKPGTTDEGIEIDRDLKDIDSDDSCLSNNVFDSLSKMVCSTMFTSTSPSSKISTSSMATPRVSVFDSSANSSSSISAIHTRLTCILGKKLASSSKSKILGFDVKYSNTMTSLYSSLFKLYQLISIHVSKCVSQGSSTDSIMSSLQCRVEGKKCDDAFIKNASLIDAEEHVEKQCDDESACLNDLSKLLCLDGVFMCSCAYPSDEFVAEDIISTLSSVLDMLSVYIAIVCEFHEALCLCVLRVHELRGYLPSVREVENSEVELEGINNEMDVLKRLMRKNRIKLNGVHEDVSTQELRLSRLRSSVPGASSSSFDRISDSSLSDEIPKNIFEFDIIDSVEIAEPDTEDSILKNISLMKKNVQLYEKNISGIRKEMKKRYLRCVTLQLHANILASVGFTIPTQLDISSSTLSPISKQPDGIGDIASQGGDSPMPVIFSSGVALGMFQNISELRGGAPLDICQQDDCIQTSFLNAGNIFTAEWDRSIEEGTQKDKVRGGAPLDICQQDDCIQTSFLNAGNIFTAEWDRSIEEGTQKDKETTKMKVILKFFDLPISKTSEGSHLPKSYRNLIRSAFSARIYRGCPYIVPLLCVFYDEHVFNISKSGAYLVFPYYSRGDMTTWITRFSPSVASVQKVLKCILHALSFLHQRHIVHCDLKPQNVLIDDQGNGLLCDFEGAADCGERSIGLLSQTMRIGTRSFIAPEIELEFKQHRHPHPSPASDMFSFGILVRGVFDILKDVSMPEEVCSICDACASPSPQDRPSAIQILGQKWFL
ncbi:hypothetical protein ADUPG1_012794 [Aduncisulcus paluster]|uniref:mitogen-activated protein kinase kinase n=1 Tax=Aduncisulcus paluster TaxID=2918883 RepID=A0ABQ5K2Q9_9EUKA|nr:hypothetical protein ADUPG1_012794 [Aduncisulcus paluster]